MTPLFSLGAALLGAVVGSLLASRYARTRERNTVLRGAVATYLTASIEANLLAREARRTTGGLNQARFDEMNRTTVETEEALWLTLPDDKLVQLARDVSRATGDVLTSWSFRYTDGEFESARVRCRVAQVALFRQAQRSYGGSNKAGLPPHLSTMPLPNSTATT